MKLFSKLLLFVIYVLFCKLGVSQELNCSVSVSSSKVEGSYKQVYEQMQKDIYEFMNSRNWTNNTFGVVEKVECNLFIDITKQISSNRFEAVMHIQSRRPIYNSTYESPILNIKDNDIIFDYVEQQPLIFNESQISDNNLVNILAFYAYIILGYDYDTFSLLGGSPYFDKAENIVDQCQNVSEEGWKSFDGDKNRYWLAENTTNKSYVDFRTLLYEYHRKGLDIMYTKINEGRTHITEAIENLEKVNNMRYNLYIIRMFLDAKQDEIIDLFSEGPYNERKRVAEILSKIDPSNSNIYNEMTKTN